MYVFACMFVYFSSREEKCVDAFGVVRVRACAFYSYAFYRECVCVCVCACMCVSDQLVFIKLTAKKRENEREENKILEAKNLHLTL